MRHQYLIPDILAQIYYPLQIIYVRDEFNLKEPPDAFRFFFELHNLPSAFPPDDELINVAPKLESLLETVTNAQMSSFTKKPTKKKKTGEADLDNSNAPPGNSTWGGSHLARELSNLGIQLGSGECPGWDRINDVRSSAFVGLNGN